MAGEEVGGWDKPEEVGVDIGHACVTAAEDAVGGAGGAHLG